MALLLDVLDAGKKYLSIRAIFLLIKRYLGVISHNNAPLCHACFHIMVILGVNNKIYIFCLYIRKLWVSDHTDTPVCFNRIGCPHRGQHTQLFFYSQELLIDIPVLKGSEGCHPKMMKEPKNSSYLL